MPAQAIAAHYRRWLREDAGRKSPDPLEMTDAAWECRHGRLAHDAWRTPECRCWATARLSRSGKPLKINYPARRRPAAPPRNGRWWISTGNRLGEHPQASEWESLYDNGRGESVESIGERAGVSPTTVLRHLHALGVEVRPGGRPRQHDPDREVVEALLAENTVVETAMALGMGRRTLFRLLARWREEDQSTAAAA